MPDAAFRLMALMFRIRGLFIRNPSLFQNDQGVDHDGPASR